MVSTAETGTRDERRGHGVEAMELGNKDLLHKGQLFTDGRGRGRKRKKSHMERRCKKLHVTTEGRIKEDLVTWAQEIK